METHDGQFQVCNSAGNSNKIFVLSEANSDKKVHFVQPLEQEVNTICGKKLNKYKLSLIRRS